MPCTENPTQNKAALAMARHSGFTGAGLQNALVWGMLSNYPSQNEYDILYKLTGGGNFSNASLNYGGSDQNASKIVCYNIANKYITLPATTQALQGVVGPQGQALTGGQILTAGLTAGITGTILRFVEGLAGGILLIIGLMMFVKQISGKSMISVPGKMGKLL